MTRIVAFGLVVVALAVGAALYFEPWRALTSSEVDETAPVSAGAAVSADAQAGQDGTAVEPAEATPPTSRTSRGGAAASKPSPEPAHVVLATGEFEDAEYETSGKVRLLELSDGRRFVRIEKLATSDGPDLKIWLTDQPSGGEWDSYDDGRYLDLGDLKATNGNLNYEIPANAKLDGFTSLVIWCDRFDVATGSAAVTL